MLPEPDLNQIEEIPTWQIPPDLPCTERDLHPERPEFGNRVKRRRNEVSGRGFKGELRSTEHIQPQCGPDSYCLGQK